MANGTSCRLCVANFSPFVTSTTPFCARHHATAATNTPQKSPVLVSRRGETRQCLGLKMSRTRRSHSPLGCVQANAATVFAFRCGDRLVTDASLGREKELGAFEFA